ncbi:MULTISPECIES: hypothetical protein [Rhodococcus]|uniref:Secreted protein n=1 Tax=Rhodococcus jostii (strain RHA1) TaxID=101510 RepID=Q0SF33_RHOJR|nr:MULTISPECIES: hypothetical protein [Rhodococcus]ABG93853.1 hypothetical protein RHA1_ro02046 [Rhodococcus jostii RHA1]
MRRVRMLLGGIGIATAVAMTGTGIAAAAPDAPPPGERVTTLQVPPIGMSPVLAAYFTVEAVTGRAPGVVLLRTVSECYLLNSISAQQTCIPGPGNSMRANAVRVHWLNVNTGASGAATIPIGTVGSTDSPRPEVDVATGAGRIVVSTTAPAEYPQSLLPGFGTFDVP